ncbi:glycosyltransferase family 2 protein [Halovenus sp. HT40]|uniref:glycosyltransferase family 2 protein n=1 Tax=Halovenus sp. HT40 TaxID=3126691 RepID=UPI00300EAE6A
MTTYNRPSYLERAVHSVLNQTYDNIELVVVDDHSETPASETLSEIDLSGLAADQCVRHEENQGANAARNTGIDAASGEYIAFLDDDDRWVPEKIERQVAAFRDGPDELGAVYTGLKTEQGDGFNESIPPEIDIDLTKALLCENVVGSLSVFMVRADLAAKVRLDERFPCWADLEWYINLSRHAEFERIPDPLVIYESDSHNRLTTDIKKKQAGYDLFVEEFSPVAKEYGSLFYRKMRGWAAYRLGASAYYRGFYSRARQYLTLAVVMYPLESSFFILFVASLGGKPVHKTVRYVRS